MGERERETKREREGAGERERGDMLLRLTNHRKGATF